MEVSFFMTTKKRRGNGEGCIRQLKDKTWEARIMIGRNANGNPKFKTFTSKKRSVVAAKLAEYIANRNNEPLTSANYTVEKWLLQWFDNYVAINVKDSTKVSYEGIIKKHLIPQIGHIKLSNLKKVDIEMMYRTLLESGRADGKGGLSVKTIHNVSLVLHKALDEALKCEYIPKNPADAANSPTHRSENSSKKAIDVLSKSEQQALMAACGDDVYGVAILTALYTGLRKGELLGLKWSDIDFQAKTMTVQRQLNRLKDYSPDAKAKTRLGLQEDTKTESSHRTISLPNPLVEILLGHQRRQNTVKERWGKSYQDLDMVFARDDGNYIDPATFGDHYHKILNKAGLGHFTIHALRHTFATRALEAGVPIKVVSQILGHSGVQITMDTYSHVLPDLQSQSMNKVADYIAAE